MALSRWWFPLTLCSLMLLAALLPWGDELRYQRGALEAGQWWRLLTAHLVHLGGWHLLLNLFGLLLVWFLVGPFLSAGRALASFMAGAIGISAGLYWAVPVIDWYVGFSGVLHGLLMTGALMGLTRQPAFCGALILLVAVKVGLETAGVADTGTAALIGGRVIHQAHLFGALSGLAVGGVLLVLPRLSQQDGSTR